MLKPHGQYWHFEHLAMNPDESKEQMLKWKDQGITALEVFAPEEGGNSYDGLDAKDRYGLSQPEGAVPSIPMIRSDGLPKGIGIT
jgi:hypothetical protein